MNIGKSAVPGNVYADYETLARRFRILRRWE